MLVLFAPTLMGVMSAPAIWDTVEMFAQVLKVSEDY